MVTKRRFWKFINIDPSEDIFWHHLGAGVMSFLLTYAFQFYVEFGNLGAFSPILPIFLFVLGIAADEAFLRTFPLSKEKKYERKKLLLRGALGIFATGILVLVCMIIFYFLDCY